MRFLFLTFFLSLPLAAKADIDIGVYACSGPHLEDWEGYRLTMEDVAARYPQTLPRPEGHYSLLRRGDGFVWSEDWPDALSLKCLDEYEIKHAPQSGHWRQIGPFSILKNGCEVPDFKPILGVFPRQMAWGWTLDPMDILQADFSDWDHERDTETLQWSSYSDALQGDFEHVRNLVVSFDDVRADYIHLSIFVGAWDGGCEDIYHIMLYRDGP